MAQILIKKVAQGKYVAYKGKEKVATLTFGKKYRPAPWLPVGFEIIISVRGKLEKGFAQNITAGKLKLIRAVGRN